MKYYLEKGWKSESRHLPPGFGVAKVGQTQQSQPVPVQAQITPERSWRTEYRNLPPKFGIAAGAIPGGPRRRVAARTARGLGGYGSGYGIIPGINLPSFDLSEIQKWGADKIKSVFGDEVGSEILRQLAEVDRQRDEALKREAAKKALEAIRSAASSTETSSGIPGQLTQAAREIGLMTLSEGAKDILQKYRTPIYAGLGIVGLLLAVRVVRGLASPYSKK